STPPTINMASCVLNRTWARMREPLSASSIVPATFGTKGGGKYQAKRRSQKPSLVNLPMKRWRQNGPGRQSEANAKARAFAASSADIGDSVRIAFHGSHSRDEGELLVSADTGSLACGVC